MHVAIVHGARSIHFVAVAEDRAALMARICDYVQQQADVQLYPEDAHMLNVLIGTGAAEAAVQFYFKRVGERWDCEWLEERTSVVSRTDLEVA